MSTRLARAAVALLVATVTVGACGGDDEISPDSLTEALVGRGLDRPTAECIATTLADTLSADEFEQVALAQDGDDMSPEMQDQVLDVTARCVLGEDG